LDGGWESPQPITSEYLAFLAESLVALEYAVLDEPRHVMQLIHRHMAVHGHALLALLADRPSPGPTASAVLSLAPPCG
jgi:hypothetical protein